ncbi:LOW QUALITY PROTEIN: Hypothetical protein PHPALM_10538 [Phytophthora palmivora]|uniref:PiggyBac transposable element-derived protein domain-containing protein n=1 Tax=Phytophthora palmivora TaxID=4796 RepID=A0A2P4Y4H0_9STRA|nr:LOW QUALITY PROTEIN: Hypothetical protein PHPALM_10538 [Phytophthora palmivora]
MINLIMSSDWEDDLNEIEEGEDPEDYGDLDSGDESAEDDIVDEDDPDDIAEDEVNGITNEELEDGDTEDPNRQFLNGNFAEKFLESLGGSEKVLVGDVIVQDTDKLRAHSVNGWSDPIYSDVYEYLQTPYEVVSEDNSNPDLRREPHGPTPEAMKCGDSPLALFFFFMPVALWQHIAVCSNNYKHEQLEARVEAYITRRNKIQHRHPEDTTSIRTPRDVRMSLMAVQPVLPHELCVFIGLLLARAIQPNREKISNHWKMSDEGGIAKGVFRNYMPRDRFMEISRNLHFSSNLDPRAKTDRAWKIRKVVHVLQRTFRRGYTPPAELAFDEAMLPSRSSFNTTRVYMKDKPCKWGTKFFMLCSAHTAFEVYVGKKQHTGDTKSMDKKSGPAAVVRNLKAAFPEGCAKGFRLVVTDRFYTSVVLAIQLLLMGFYTVGTIMPNRIGFANGIKEKRKTRPQEIMRGSFKYVSSNKVKEMTAITWWDSKPVLFLCTGSDLALERVIRREKTGERHEVACPKAVKDYHEYMGGVDVHDQLRLQRYSLQRAVTFRKYYKSLFLRLVDLAIVNG